MKSNLFTFTFTYLVVALSTVIASAKVYAYPGVKDSVTYEAYIVTADKLHTINFIQELTLVSFDKKKSQYMMKSAIYLPNDTVKESQQAIASTDIKTTDQIQKLIVSCDTSGGSREVIEVAAGKFDTCHLHDENGNHIWLGDVPFNIVKQISFDSDKNAIYMEVSLIQQGQ